MAKYVVLIDYTQEGIEEFDQSPERLEELRERTREMGGEIEEFYLTLGQYDAAAVVDVPDASVAAAGSITAAQQGTVSTETMRAFDESEMGEIVEMLST